MRFPSGGTTGSGSGGSAGTLPPMMSEGEAFAKISPGTSPEVRKAAETYIRQQLNERKVMQADEQARLHDELEGGIERLGQGLSYNWDEGYIRSYFEPKTAEVYIRELNVAKSIGDEYVKIKDAPAQQTLDTLQRLQNNLTTTPPDEQKETEALTAHYVAVAKQHLVGLGLWPDESSKAPDPVGYLTVSDPKFQNLRGSLDFNNPDSVQAYGQKP